MLLWEKRLQTSRQQRAWEAQDKIPARLGHWKLPEVIKQGAAAVCVSKTLFYVWCNSLQMSTQEP